MSTIVLRSVKNAPLTNTEVDTNFTNLNNDKTQLGGTYSSGTANGVLFLSSSKVLTTGSALTFDGAAFTNTAGTINAAGFASRATGGEGGQISLQNPTNTGNVATFDVLNATTARLFTEVNNAALQIGQLSGTGAILTFHTASAERMRINSDGNVGIGANSPACSLQVNGGIRARGGAPGALGVNNNGFGFSGNSGDVDGGMYSSADGQIEFYTDAVERMRITSAGNLGIGTSSPDSRLTVQTAGASNGTVASRSGLLLRADNISTGFASSRIQWTYGGLGVSTKAYIEGGVFGADYLAFSGDGSSEDMRIDPSGNVNIGANKYFGLDTNAKYIPDDSSLGGALYTGGGFRFFTGGANERMRIDSSGNVGIGTSSPNASAILDAQSTTKGVRMPNMTTTQKNAIASPAAGLMVYDTTLAKLCVYTTAWETITSI
jgi:hypothetical protein